MEIKTVMQTPSEDCTGCAACANICPVDAIAMKPDSEGFLRPIIDKEKCVGCGKCAAICPVLPQNKIDVPQNEPQCYAAWSKDEEIRFNSTSGGIFTHLAQAVLENGGAVVGARYRDDNLVEHALIRSVGEIEQLRQSKYVQSEIGTVFREIKSELASGKPVLFAGTPCQCAGLSVYLEKDYENLILCDFICLGVNSPKIYTAYLQELEKKYNSRVKTIWFKNKTFGWKNFATKIVFMNGQEYIADRDTDAFMLGYVQPQATMYMRKSCYQCHFKGVSRPTDITLADFWGVEKILPNIDIKHGVSAVLIHSENGHNLFDQIKDDICCIQSVPSNIIKSNPRIISSASTPPESEKFWKDFNQNGKFSELICKLI